MSSVHFLLVSIFAAVMRLAMSSPYLTFAAFFFATLGLYASFVEFKRYGFDRKPLK